MTIKRGITYRSTSRPIHRRYLRSKIQRPRPHPDSVQRNRFGDSLAESPASLWLVSAPAGYGKTTLLSQMLETVDGEIAWVSVDSLDNDPIRFWTHVAAAVVGEGEVLENLLDWLEPEAVDRVVDTLVAHIEAQAHRVFLVLDDMHEIHDREIFASLARILNHSPENLTLAVATRADPALPVGRLRSLGKLFEVRAADLAFTAPEAAELFGDRLEPGIVENMVTGTEGWVTALQMLAVSSGPSRSAEQLLEAAITAQSDLAEFLAGEVLAVQNEETRRFLVETSVLDDLDPAICDTVTGRPGSLAMLRTLARTQVFTQLLDPETDTFRYHPLFRGFLRSRAQELDPNRLRALHSAAARWFADRDRPTPAIVHAVHAQDFGQALTVLKQHYIAYSEAGRVTTIREWLDVYGHDRCRNEPDLRLAGAWVCLTGRCYDEVDSWLESPSADSPADSNSFMVEAHTIRSHRARHRGDLETALSQAKLACENIDDDASLAATVAYAALGMAMVLAGRTDVMALNAAVKTGGAHNVDSSMVVGYSYLSLLASEEPDRIEEAEALADQALGYVTTPVLEHFHQPAVALLVKSRVALARGLVGDAAHFADRAEAIAEAASEPLVSVLVLCQRARVAHLHGAAKDVRALLRRAESVLGGNGADHLRDAIRVTRNKTRFVHPERRHSSFGAIQLSERELAVLRLLPYGLARRELAAQLHVSENTVKSHLTSIRHKLGAIGEANHILLDRALDLGVLDKID